MIYILIGLWLYILIGAGLIALVQFLDHVDLDMMELVTEIMLKENKCGAEFWISAYATSIVFWLPFLLIGFFKKGK